MDNWKTKTRKLIFALCAALVVILLILTGSSLYFLNEMFVRRVERMDYRPEDYDLPAESVSFTSPDVIPLQAWLVKADDPRGIVVLLHGMDGQDASTVLGHARFLHQAGYASLVLDMRAHGRSGGQRIGLAFEEPGDAAAALNWIEGQPEYTDLPRAVLGVSLGGATAIRTAAARPDVEAVISVSAFGSVNMMIEDAFEMMMEAPTPVVKIFTPFIRLAFRILYGVWPGKASPLEDIPDIPPRPILIAHGDSDSQVSVANAYALAEAANGQAELWIVEDAEHFIYKSDGTAPEDAFYRRQILAFLNENLGD